MGRQGRRLYVWRARLVLGEWECLQPPFPAVSSLTAVLLINLAAAAPASFIRVPLHCCARCATSLRCDAFGDARGGLRRIQAVQGLPPARYCSPASEDPPSCPLSATSLLIYLAAGTMPCEACVYIPMLGVVSSRTGSCRVCMKERCLGWLPLLPLLLLRLLRGVYREQPARARARVSGKRSRIALNIGEL